VTTGVEAIASGAASLVLAGGAESLSDAPIRFRRAVRKRLMASRRARGPAAWLRLLRGLSPSDLLPEVPSIAEFTTGLTMGRNAERLAKRLGITRAEQDAFALSSHRRAAAAAADGRFADEIVPLRAGPSFAAIAADDGIRADSTEEKLARLSTPFDRPFGTVTAASSSFLTDGAAVCLLGSAEAAKASGVAPIARIASIAFSGLDPLEELLLGPAVAIPRALDTAGVRLSDVGVLEIHEAFAVPVLAAARLLADDSFCRARLGRSGAAGKVDMARVNAWGGSLSLGHPFGATAARLLSTCARRMQAEGSRWGVASACAAGGLGHAVLLERM
jgi:acetyl-CoA acyltransferase